MQLEGTIGIITGASGGIGGRIAERLAGEGVRLALAARDGEQLERAAASIARHGARAVPIATDVREPAQLDALVRAATDELGPPDLLVNAAGTEEVMRFEEASYDDIVRIVHTNVVAMEELARLVVPGMISRGRGHILNLASAAAKTAYPYDTINASSKHAIVGFSWALREELKPHGVGVSAVCPGFVRDVGVSSRRRVGKPPALVGSVPVDRVAAAAVRLIKRDRAEAIVAPGLGRYVDVFHALSPALSSWAARTGGLYRYLEREASMRSKAASGDGQYERRADPTRLTTTRP